MAPKKLPPWFAGVRRGVETCAEPGECGEDAVEEIELGGVSLGFCARHARRRS